MLRGHRRASRSARLGGDRHAAGHRSRAHRRAGARGTRAAAVITAGLSKELKQAALDQEKRYCLRIIGPNCLSIAFPRSDYRRTPDDIRFRFLTPRKEFCTNSSPASRRSTIRAPWPSWPSTRSKLLGVARLAADPDYVTGEYAIIVRSDLKGAGIGWSLMGHLIAYAENEGLRELVGDVLAGNERMLDMSRALGFEIATIPRMARSARCGSSCRRASENRACGRSPPRPSAQAPNARSGRDRGRWSGPFVDRRPPARP
jgi:GNAT superfamily N-acetyltransferase